MFSKTPPGQTSAHSGIGVLWQSLLAMLLAAALSGAGMAFAQTKASNPPSAGSGSEPKAAAKTVLPEGAEKTTPQVLPLSLSAVMGTNTQVITTGLIWRVFAVRDPGQTLSEIARSDLASPVLSLAPGDYVIHAAYGLGSAARRITLKGEGSSERLSLPVGAISVRGMVNDKTIDPKDLSIAVYIPSEINSEERLVTDQLKSGELLRLPVGTYHIVSTYGGSNASVRADIEVQSGKAIDVLMRHRAARITLKLVSKVGGEAIANTEWTVLTPGGDVVKEELGAFPSVILAEGAYTAIARHDGQTYVEEIKVTTGPDHDVEVLAAMPAQ
jgi:hypothetical protein